MFLTWEKCSPHKQDERKRNRVTYVWKYCAVVCVCVQIESGEERECKNNKAALTFGFVLEKLMLLIVFKSGCEKGKRVKHLKTKHHLEAFLLQYPFCVSNEKHLIVTAFYFVLVTQEITTSLIHGWIRVCLLQQQVWKGKLRVFIWCIDIYAGVIFSPIFHYEVIFISSLKQHFNRNSSYLHPFCFSIMRKRLFILPLWSGDFVSYLSRLKVKAKRKGLLPFPLFVVICF